MIFRWPISVSHFNKFRLPANFYRFRCLLAIFDTKIMIVLYHMGLFFNSTLCGVTFDSRDQIFKIMFSLEVLLQTPNSASVSDENGKSLALNMYVADTTKGW